MWDDDVALDGELHGLDDEVHPVVDSDCIIEWEEVG